jgi:hypothetical protein
MPFLGQLMPHIELHRFRRWWKQQHEDVGSEEAVAKGGRGEMGCEALCLRHANPILCDDSFSATKNPQKKP